MTKPDHLSWKLGSCSAVLIIATIFAACARSHVWPFTTRSGICSVVINNGQLIEIPTDVNQLQKQPNCIDYIAANQSIGYQTTQLDVPPVQRCANSQDTVHLVAYLGTGQLKYAGYGPQGGGKRGYIVGQVINLSQCATAGPHGIPAHTSAYWIVEIKNGNSTPNARLVIPSSDADVNNYANYTFRPCSNGGHPTNDLIAMKQPPTNNPCAENLHTFAAESADSGRGPIVAPYGLWIPCGGDCCYTDM